MSNDETKKELEVGIKTCLAVVEHVIRMGAAKMTQSVEIGAYEWIVTAIKVDKLES